MKNVKRYASVSRLKPEKADYYKHLHANIWPQINDMIKQCNIQNYSIYFYNNILFSYFEYTGDDYDADMKKMAADPETQRWWKECVPCMNPYTKAGPWLDIDEVYHLD
ncbi:MAG: L-rhamnose mutarotase [Clostridia bacterium]|jgi:L-rhamnose mutarotase|nr:L-rhamnose mutarotase [Clostridia bacterium]